MPDEGSDSGFRYWAFISYSHVDKAWGDWLHRALETYRVPKRLVGTITPSGERVPARVFPIFRDREELPVSASLPENINDALAQSRYLIVICSPRSAASRWVNEEIKTFKRLGREGRVLALIVAGEPNASEDGGKPGFRMEDECFPPALRYRWDRDGGELSDERTEPIAADARPDKDGKRHAKLKLLAGLLQVNYDQLRQREHERRVRQLSYLVSTALVLLAVFAGIAVYSEVQRRRAEQATSIAQEQRQNADNQRQIAETQRKNANAQRKVAEEQEAEATRQRNTALQTNRRLQAQIHQACLSDLSAACNLFDKGSWREALLYAQRAGTYDDPLGQLAGQLLWNQVVYGRGDRDRLPVHILKHEKLVRYAMFCDGGRRIITIAADKTQVWDAVSGQPLGRPLPEISGERVLDHTSDGVRIAVRIGTTGVQVWDALQGAPFGPVLLLAEEANQTYLNADGTRLLAIFKDGSSQIWDTKGPNLGTLAVGKGGIHFAGFNQDGSCLFTAAADHTIHIWNASTGKAITPAIRCTNEVQTFRFSPDGKRILVGVGESRTPSRTRQLYDATSGATVGKPINTFGAFSPAFSPDGSRVLISTNEHTGVIVDSRSGKATGTVLRFPSAVSRLIFSPDGTRLLTSCESSTDSSEATTTSVQVWDAAKGESISPAINLNGKLEQLCFSPDGTLILTGGDDGTVCLWDTTSGKLAGEIIRTGITVSTAEFSPDGMRILTLGYDQTARIFSTATNEVTGESVWHKDKEDDLTLNLSANGTRLLVASQAGSLHLLDTATWKPVVEQPDLSFTLRSAFLRPDGNCFATVDKEATVRLWDARTGKLIGEPMLHPAAVKSVEFSPDGRRILTACEDGQARQWEIATGKMIGGSLSHAHPLSGAKYSPDGAQIVTASSWSTSGSEADVHQESDVQKKLLIMSRLVASQQGEAQLWDAASGRPIGRPLPCPAWIASVRFSPDGRRIVTACCGRPDVEGGQALLWDAATGTPVGEVMVQPGSIGTAEFSPDGTRLLTAGPDRTARLWDALTGKPVGTALLHDHNVTSASFSRDGASVLTTSGADAVGVACFWDAATGKKLSAPLRLTGDNDDSYRAIFSVDGKQVLTADTGDATGFEKTGTVRVWQARAVLPPPPEWLAELVQVLSGMRFDPNGDLVSLNVQERVRSRDHLRLIVPGGSAGSTPRPDSDWEPWAAWVLASSSVRPLSPRSSSQVSDYADREIAHGRPTEVLEALRLVPEHPLAHLALAASESDETRAAFLRQYDLRRLPANAVLYARTAAMLREQSESQLAVQILEKLLDAAPANPDRDLLASLVLTRWLCSDKDGAIRDCQRLLLADPGYADSAKLPAILAMSESDRTALLAAVAETLRRHPELSSKLGR